MLLPPENPLKVLILCSTVAGGVTPFVKEQVNSISKGGEFTFDYAEIKSKGMGGYLKGYLGYIKQLLTGNYDLVHAHYGLSGFLACMRLFKPVVVTFHGCDVNDIKTRRISKIAYKLCSHAIFVEGNMPAKLNAKANYSVIPCGTDITIFKPMDKQECRKVLGLNENTFYALFSSGFDVPVKNSELARKACSLANITLLELKNCDRQKVNLLLNACDLLLLTSIREGSPQIIKEAMAANCPIISTDVGDVKLRIGNIEGCYIVPASEHEIAEKIREVIKAGKRTESRQALIDAKLDLNSVAQQIATVYKTIVK